MWLKCLLQRGFILWVNLRIRWVNLRDDGPQTGERRCCVAQMIALSAHCALADQRKWSPKSRIGVFRRGRVVEITEHRLAQRQFAASAPSSLVA